MDTVNVIVCGADKLAKQLDEISDLIVLLRRRLGDLDERRMTLEIQLNQALKPLEGSSDSETTTE